MVALWASVELLYSMSASWFECRSRSSSSKSGGLSVALSKLEPDSKRWLVISLSLSFSLFSLLFFAQQKPAEAAAADAQSKCLLRPEHNARASFSSPSSHYPRFFFFFFFSFLRSFVHSFACWLSSLSRSLLLIRSLICLLLLLLLLSRLSLSSELSAKWATQVNCWQQQQQ